MDIFKLAFETTVVGLLAFLWIGLAGYLLYPEFVGALVTEKIPKYENQTILGVAALTAAYCLGSAILPVANQLVNDEHWPLTESALRCQVFTRQEVRLENIHDTALPKDKGLTLENLQPIHCSYWAPVFAPADGEDRHIGARIWGFLRLWVGSEVKTNEDDQNLSKNCEEAKTRCDGFKQRRILTLFQLEESAVLNQSSDKTERLRQLHERIVVLRGAVFSGFVLFLVCLCAYFARETGHKAHWLRTGGGILVALGFTVFALINGYRDFKNSDIFDLPILEGLLVVITVFGLMLVFRGFENRRFQMKRYPLVVLFFAGLAYGGWMWSEIIYDQEVISSFAVLQREAPAQKP